MNHLIFNETIIILQYFFKKKRFSIYFPSGFLILTSLHLFHFQKADLAIADLSITYEREKAVDFSNPFMTLGVSILYRKSHKQAPELFSFMHPLSLDVWIYMVFAYLLVSILLYILARYAYYIFDLFLL